MAKLRIDDKTDVKKALDCALLNGFFAETALFPVITPGDEIDIPDDILPSALPEDYFPAPKAGPLWNRDFRNKKGLEYLLSEGMFLRDTDHDLLPDKLDVKISLPCGADKYLLAAACNLSYRFGMETTGIDGSIYADSNEAIRLISFTGIGSPEIVLSENGSVVINGYGDELFTFISTLCNTFPKLGPFRTWRDELMDMTDDLCMKTADGQLAYANAHDGKKILFGSPDITDEHKALFPDVTFENHKSGREVWSQTFEYPWEVDEFIDIFKKNVLPNVKKGDTLYIEGAVSEDKESRTMLRSKLLQLAFKEGVIIEDIQLVCAYKQGFSWIDEVVIPQLLCSVIDKVTIAFKPYLAPGETEWRDENGATPSYHNIGGSQKEKWLDLPIRWLQELYPIADVISSKLKIDKNAIDFVISDTDEDITYAVQAGDMRFTYKVHTSERQFMDDYPDMGKVHPSAGYIKAYTNDRIIYECDIKTDLELIWDSYQSDVLPSVRRWCEEKYPDISPADQPFFNQLKLEIYVSEPDYRLPSRQDMISSLDAMHEDMYFLGGDYFKNFGNEKCGKMFDAPGLILPVIHKANGAPRFTASLYEQLSPHPYLTADGNIVAHMRSREEISLFISRISYDNGLVFDISTQGVSDALLCSYCQLINKGIITKGCGALRFINENGDIFDALPQVKTCEKCKNIADINIHEGTLFSYEMYVDVMEQLKQIPGVEVFETARSYMGRKLYALWFVPEYKGYLSMTKRISRLPSEIINSRHHANEVSSTNSAFMLIKKLLTDEKYADLPDKMNLVIVPLENVDGAAIHYELQGEHPNWKLHVARFNSIGNEFYREHFNNETMHTEAMGLTRLYEKFIPDILVDNHGVPSHEWDQQFSGYTSPSYKGFWLPRSLLYGYFWYVTNDEYRCNFTVNKRMEDVIADRIAEDTQMTALNKEWSREFEKYAHAWLPKLFPADYYKDMIDYWIPFASDSNHRYPSIRFPWLTTVSYTSEVADETAHGDYLDLCARAHLAHDEATIDMILGAQHIFDKYSNYETMKARYIRHRPMIV